MRVLIALSLCCLALGAASANEPPTRLASVQPSSPARADAMGLDDARAKPAKPGRKLSAEELEEQAEAALSARIAERLAQSRSTVSGAKSCSRANRLELNASFPRNNRLTPLTHSAGNSSISVPSWLPSPEKPRHTSADRAS